jgi:uncharacterized protein (TIGR00369 family)
MTSTTLSRLDDERIAHACEVFEQRIPFNQVLGFRLEEVTASGSRISFAMRPELVGNYMRGSLHGGVIASALDTVGGLVAFVSLLDRIDSQDDGIARLANVGTIDLRVDYVRSGVGRSFVATGQALRAGNKVAVVRMELHNDEGVLVAAGTGTYLIG